MRALSILVKAVRWAGLRACPVSTSIRSMLVNLYFLMNSTDSKPPLPGWGTLMGLTRNPTVCSFRECCATIKIASLSTKSSVLLKLTTAAQELTRAATAILICTLGPLKQQSTVGRVMCLLDSAMSGKSDKDRTQAQEDAEFHVDLDKLSLGTVVHNVMVIVSQWQIAITHVLVFWSWTSKPHRAV